MRLQRCPGAPAMSEMPHLTFDLDVTDVSMGLLVADKDAAPDPSAADSRLRYRLKPALPAG